MKLKNVLKQLDIPVGLTSLIAAPESTGGGEKILDPAISDVEAEITKLKTAQDNCKSDAAFWGYAGQLAYWRTLRNVLKAALLVGSDNLPDMELPVKMSVLMDRIGDMEEFGKKMLAEAERMADDG